MISLTDIIQIRSGNFHQQPRLAMRFAHLKPNMPKSSNKHQGLRGKSGTLQNVLSCGEPNAHIHNETEFTHTSFQQFEARLGNTDHLHIWPTIKT